MACPAAIMNELALAFGNGARGKMRTIFTEDRRLVIGEMLFAWWGWDRPTFTRRTSGGGSNFSSIVASRAMLWRAGCPLATAASSAQATTEEIMNKASCLSLLSNAVLVWNT